MAKLLYKYNTINSYIESPNMKEQKFSEKQFSMYCVLAARIYIF